MGRPVVHWELWSKDPEQLAQFYERVFDWNSKDVPGMNYRMVETGGEGGINGGIMKPQEGPWPGNLALYVDVPDLTEYRERVRAAGGRILVEQLDLPGMGSITLFEDPDGRVTGMWQALRGES
jgi:predicted enzyme related to lactoylglutathione lyase